jgi:hypothetical protein
MLALHDHIVLDLGTLYLVCHDQLTLGKTKNMQANTDIASLQKRTTFIKVTIWLSVICMVLCQSHNTLWSNVEYSHHKVSIIILQFAHTAA